MGVRGVTLSQQRHAVVVHFLHSPPVSIRLDPVFWSAREARRAPRDAGHEEE
jgi:hypothetical protein